MRSQVAVEEITARAGRLAQRKEKEVRQKAKEKNLIRTDTEKTSFY